MWAAACARGPSKPSLLLVVVEGVRPDHMSLYGYSERTTPALEALGREGAVFERAYTSAPESLAALAGLLTGRYGPEHGLLLGGRLDEAAVTLAEHLGERGYATHAVSSEPEADAESGLLQGFEGAEIVDPTDVPDLDAGAAETTRRAVAWLRQGWDRKRPFFLMLIYSSTTLPFDPPEGFRYRFLDPGAGRQRVEAVSRYWRPFARRFTAGEFDLSATEIEILKGLYDGEIAYADERIGDVVNALREDRFLDRTLFVLASDRGEDLGDGHRLADTGSLKEANLRVPLLMRLPGRVPAMRVPALAQEVDLVPTICDVLEVERPASISPLAVSQWPIDGSPRRNAAVSTAIWVTGPHAADLVLSVRDDTHRYDLSPEGPLALYDLKSDPDGALNVIQQQTETAQRMEQWLRYWDGHLSPLGGPAQAPPAPSPGEPEKVLPEPPASHPAADQQP